MRTSAAIITSFAALAACAPLHSRALPVAGLDVPVDVPNVAGANVAVLPQVDMDTIQSAIDLLNGMLAEQKASKRDALNVPVVNANNIAGDLEVVPTVENVVSNLGGILKRADIGIPVVSINIYPTIYAPIVSRQISFG